MQFEELLSAVFLRRYKRFLVDVRFPDLTESTVYCPNTGSMRTCLTPGCEVLLSRASNPQRKYGYTLEMARPSGCWVGINTARTNGLVHEALLAGVIGELGRAETIQSEPKVSRQSRLDFLLRKKGGEQTYIEVKNCTLVRDGVASFPDAVTVRGAKHLDELMRLRRDGYGACMLFVVQRMDGSSFCPAWDIDPQYSSKLMEAFAQGVQVLAYQARVSPAGIEIHTGLPVALDHGLCMSALSAERRQGEL